MQQRVPVALILLWAAMLALGAPAAESSTPQPAASLPALKLQPEWRDRFVSALGAYRASDWNAAVGGFSDPGWATTPLRDYALLFQAESLMRTGESVKARATAKAAIDGGSLSPTGMLQAAFLLSSAGDDAGAAAVFRRFLERHSDHADAARARLGLAQALLAAGQPADASRALSEIWLQAPASTYAEVAARQLSVLSSQGITGPPPSQKDRLERAERLLGAGLAESAKTEAEALLDQGLPPELVARALKVVLEASRRAGRQDLAIATTERAIASLPTDRRAPWLLELARLQQKKNRDLAVGTLDRVIRDYPKRPEAADALLLKAQLLEGPKPVSAQSRAL